MAATTSLSIDVIWKNLTDFLDPNESDKKESKCMLAFFNEVCGGSTELQQFFLHELKAWFLEQFGKELKQNIAPKFWNSFKDGVAPENLMCAVKNLYQMVEFYRNSLSNLQTLATQSSAFRDLEENIHAIIRVVVFSNPPKKFKSAVKNFYSKAFKAHQSLARNNDTLEEENDSDVDDSCDGCSESKEHCQCQNFLDEFCSWNKTLHSLGVLKKVCSDAFVSVIHTEVRTKIEETCKGEFDQSFLSSLMEWLEDSVFDWMRTILPPQGSDMHDLDVSIVESWTPRLEYFMYKTYAELRIEELFSIIVDYPDSLTALKDLKECLEKTDLRGQLITSLRSSFETRLLHPGAETADILTQYVSAIRALRVLDSSGVILENVCEPVKAYLRTRDDTVRCIVTSLTDENSSELSEELLQGDTKTIDDVYPLDSDNEDDSEDWMPDPIDADPTKPSRSRKSSDIISMLVNIYGSRDLFVTEYRTLLADRILSSFNYDIAKELRYLELLKLRFGESHLQFCEVMLKDVADSRRINANIHSKIETSEDKPDIEIHGMILSNVFWPTFREEKLELPDQVKSSMENYTEQFKSLKGSRTLQWKPYLGLVDLELELEDRTLSFTVTPARASTIMYFQQKPRWSLEELSTAMHMPSGMLRRCLGYWLGQGVLKQESQDVYVVLEKNRGAQDLQDVVYEGVVESPMATSQDQREGELQIFWSYIVGMLTNLDSLPLDRIHSMLRMFAMSGPSASQCSVDELKRFLEKKVRDGELQFASGKYKLPKPSR